MRCDPRERVVGGMTGEWLNPANRYNSDVPFEPLGRGK